MPIDISNNQLNSVGANVLAYGNIVTDGLRLYLDAGIANSYPGSGTTWTDESGNGYNATLANGPTFNTSNGGSIVFDGTDDYGNAGSLGTITSFTVLIWFYPTSVANYQNPIDCNYSTSVLTGNLGPRLEINSVGTLGWVYSNDVNSNSVYYYQDVVSSGLAANTWHYAGITYNSSGNTSTTYYNGLATANARGSSGSPTGFVGVMSSVNLGRGFVLGGSERYYAGRVANALIYNRALSASEVLQNFNANRRRFNI